MSAFDAWAEYYDLIHRGLPGEAEFYVGQAVRKQARTLELGCGTGRIAIPITLSGVDVVGVDNSLPMLQRCRDNEAAVGHGEGRLDLICGDMAEIKLGCRFEMILMAYRTFMHLLTPERQRQCLANVRDHLTDTGLFIMNVWAARPSNIAPLLGDCSEPIEVDRFPLDDPNETVVHYYAAEYDEFNQILQEENILDTVNASGEVLVSDSLPMTRRWLTYPEMANLLQGCGFAVEAVFGDFACNPISAASIEMIWVLRRA
jgi:SAM-dependent methyltransferase